MYPFLVQMRVVARRADGYATDGVKIAMQACCDFLCKDSHFLANEEK